jgi:hypothetical protein
MKRNIAEIFQIRRKKEITFMRLNKNFWLAASGTLAVAGAIMLFSARRIEAQYSSPVRVLNTSAAPAIVSSIDDPGRIPYLAGQSTNLSSPQSSVTFTFGAVPANHRLVVQRIIGYYGLSTSSATTSISLNTSASVFITNLFTPSAAFTNQFDAPVLAYFDAGQQPQTSAYAQGAAVFTNSAFSTLIGYMLDCSAVPCSAIAH